VALGSVPTTATDINNNNKQTWQYGSNLKTGLESIYEKILISHTNTWDMVVFFVSITIYSSQNYENGITLKKLIYTCVIKKR
jgi:hypothetical protein